MIYRAWTRRRFALMACAAVPLISASRHAAARFVAPPLGGRRLELANLHTDEVVAVTFDAERGIAPATAATLRHVLRDYRLNEEHDIDPGLYLQLTDLAQAAGCEARFEVISGYRSALTNQHLHATGHGVAEHSLHMEGRAIDVRLKGCPLERLHRLALAAQRGGVGFYPRSDFIHIDTGRVRFWQE